MNNNQIEKLVLSLIFNGLSDGLANTISKECWIPLSERIKIAERIYDTLQENGVEVRVPPDPADELLDKILKGGEE